MKPAAAKSGLFDEAKTRAGVLLPLPLAGAYDYAAATELPRGTLVTAPLGPREYLACVWNDGDGKVAAEKLKDVTALDGAPRLPPALCDFVDWVARYTLSPPGQVLALALRVPAAFDEEASRIAFVRGHESPKKMTPARARVLALCGDGLARRVMDYATEANVTPSVVRGLIDAGALVETALPEFRRFPIPDPDYQHPVLNAEQQKAANAIVTDVRIGAFSANLLDGVTGSGKTETYFEAVAEALRLNKQVLILLPEIALTVQFLDRFAERFGCRPAEWHSDLSQKERRRTYRAVMNGEARVVVGARSALFLPFKELGLIVADEEHEQAYKQEEGVIYHARDMAVVRARLENCPIVLSSATPSLESYVNAASGRYTWQPLREALAVALGGGEQAMLFLNRRGYAPLTLCQSCGHKMVCRNCSTWLVEHRYHKRLTCHHCGFDVPTPKNCPECQAENSLIACGPGVERVAEEFAAVFPQARMAIASSDTWHGPAETQAG